MSWWWHGKSSFLMKFVWYLKSYLLRSSTIFTASTLHSPLHMNLDDVMLSIKNIYVCKIFYHICVYRLSFCFPHQMGIVWHYVVGCTLGRYCFKYYETQQFYINKNILTNILHKVFLAYLLYNIFQHIFQHIRYAWHTHSPRFSGILLYFMFRVHIVLKVFLAYLVLEIFLTYSST